MESHLTVRPLTPALSPEYWGEGVEREKLAACDRQNLPLSWDTGPRFTIPVHFHSQARSTALCVTYVNYHWPGTLAALVGLPLGNAACLYRLVLNCEVN
jgi:hypothetical protein